MNFRVTPLIPEGEVLFDINQLDAALEYALDRAAQRAKELFEGTVATWNNPPNFFVYTRQYGRQVTTATTGAAVLHYNLANDGDGPRVIYAKGRGMKFMIGSTPKTVPGSLSSGPGSAGKYVVRAKSVTHFAPARKFDEQVENVLKEEFPQIMQEGVDMGLGL